MVLGVCSSPGSHRVDGKQERGQACGKRWVVCGKGTVVYVRVCVCVCIPGELRKCVCVWGSGREAGGASPEFS